MPLEAIIAEIKKDAAEQAAAILAEAEERVAAIEREREESGRAEFESTLAGYKGRAQAMEKRVLTLAQLEARRQVLEARRGAVDQAFDLALRQLAGLPDAEYLQLLESIVVNSALTGHEELVLNARDRARITPGFLERVNASLRAQGRPGSVTLSARTAAISGGCILAGEEVELNASFEAALKTIRDDLETEVAAILLGDRS